MSNRLRLRCAQPRATASRVEASASAVEAARGQSARYAGEPVEVEVPAANGTAYAWSLQWSAAWGESGTMARPCSRAGSIHMIGVLMLWRVHHQTVNLVPLGKHCWFDSSHSDQNEEGVAPIGRATAFQAVCCRFEADRPLQVLPRLRRDPIAAGHG